MQTKEGKRSSKKRNCNSMHREGLLESLPDEILLMILEHLGAKELSALCCTSSRFKGITQTEGLWKNTFLYLPYWSTALSPLLTRYKGTWRMLLRSCVENEGGWRTEVKGSKVTKYLQRRKESKERKRIKKEKEEKQYINRSALTPEKVMQIVPVNDTFRVVLIGAGGVGSKTALIQRLLYGKFFTRYDPTIEESYLFSCKVDGKEVVLDVTDTAGQEDFAGLRDNAVKSGDGFLLGYSVTTQTSFDAVTKFRQQILDLQQRTQDPDSVPMVLVGNKIDFVDEREVSKEEGIALAESWGVPFFEVSAKLNINITKCVHELVRQMAVKRYARQPSCEKVVVSSNGSEYQGSVNEKFQPDGYGTCKFAPETNQILLSYTGGWKDGRKHGNGIVVISKGECYATTIKCFGIWHEGQLRSPLTIQCK